MDAAALLERALRSVRSAEDLARMIDATILAPDAGADRVEALVREASERGYACVVSTPLHVEAVSKVAERLRVRLCSVVGFPLGSHPLRLKVDEARHAAEAGAAEIDLVPALWRGPSYVEREVREVVEAVKGYGVKVKVIVEAPLWSSEVLRSLVEASARGGAFMVKTSTGVYTKGGDPYTVYRLYRLAEPLGLAVKASGGVRTGLDALLAVGAGASRIGTSSASKVLDTLRLEGLLD